MPRLLTVHPDPADLGTGSPTSSTFLDGTGAWAAIDIPAGVLTATKTFYAASSSGGSATILNTVTIVDGYITGWTQTTPGGGRTIDPYTQNRGFGAGRMWS